MANRQSCLLTKSTVLLLIANFLDQPKEILDKQFKFVAEGIDVYFPFKPYQCQIDYMTRVIRALQHGENALLESPTGTGKTLSLLCASLAWLKKERELSKDKHQGLDIPRIIYTSRTHS